MYLYRHLESDRKAWDSLKGRAYYVHLFLTINSLSSLTNLTHNQVIISNMRILIFLTLLCIAASVQAAKKKPKPAAEESSGFCVSDEDLMAICHAGSAMGKKAKTAMGACAKKMNMTMGMGMGELSGLGGNSLTLFYRHESKERKRQS